MIEFKLTDREQEILAQARAEAAVGRTYARYFDKHEDEYEPPRDVKLASETSPRDVARAHPDDISGYNIVDVLVAIEEAWGDIALRNTHRGIGSMILASGGSQELQDRYFGKVLSIAMTEPGAGSDPSSAVTARRRASVACSIGSICSRGRVPLSRACSSTSSIVWAIVRTSSIPTIPALPLIECASRNSESIAAAGSA